MSDEKFFKIENILRTIKRIGYCFAISTAIAYIILGPVYPISYIGMGIAFLLIVGSTMVRFLIGEYDPNDEDV